MPSGKSVNEPPVLILRTEQHPIPMLPDYAGMCIPRWTLFDRDDDQVAAEFEKRKLCAGAFFLAGNIIAIKPS